METLLLKASRPRSTYTAAIAPSLAHAALWPIRMIYALGYDIVNGAFDSGVIEGMMMAGGHKSNY